MSFKIEGNSANVVARLDAISPRVAEKLRNVVETLSAELLGKIKEKTPVKSGALRASMQSRVVATATGAIGEVGANPTGGNSKGSRKSYYALFIEYGATLPAREIVVSAGSVMKFSENAVDVYRRKVKFPGAKIEPEEMMRGTFKDMRKQIIARIAAAVKEGASA
jgi:hypothetical protein